MTSKYYRGVTLIIVVFVMMLLAVLGWSLVSLQSVDFESGLRQVSSDRAFNLAETGLQWALQQIRQEYTCENILGSNFPHTFDFGQYEVECDCPTCAGSGPNPPRCCGEITITSKGYVPNTTDYLAMRQVQISVTQGAFSQVLTVGGGEEEDY